MSFNPLPVADENTTTPEYERRPATGQSPKFYNERALFLDNPKLQKVPRATPQDRQTPYDPEIVLGQGDYSQNNTHALFQHNNLPNLFANLEIEPSESQTQRIGSSAIRLQSPPSRAPVAVRTPPTELWSTDQTKKNPPPFSIDQRNATEARTRAQRFSGSTLSLLSNTREDQEPRSIHSTSSIRVVPTPSILSGPNTLGLELNTSGKMKPGKPKTATRAGNRSRHYLSALYPKT